LYRILHKRPMGPKSFLMRIHAPEIAARRKAGQFVILRCAELGERFPLTIVDSDSDEGSITIVFQMVGVSTQRLGALEEGDEVLDVVGPLGNPTHVENYGSVICIGGGVGIAPAYPIAVALRDAGNRLTAIISGRTKDHVILREEMAAVADDLQVATDDGSLGIRGFPTAILEEMIERGDRIDLVLAVGPVPMMRAICEVTRPHAIRTMVSLNPIMVDGTGMCGGCRVEVGGETKFACVDGPEFDGHLVDFDLLSKRLRTYAVEEKEQARRFEDGCRLKAE